MPGLLDSSNDNTVKNVSWECYGYNNPNENTVYIYIIGLIPHKKKKKIKMINITPIDRVILRKFSKICTVLLVNFSTSFQNSFK